jgi:hypothetical protein
MWVTRELPRLNDYRIVFRVCAGKFTSYPSDCGKVDEPGSIFCLIDIIYTEEVESYLT